MSARRHHPSAAPIAPRGLPALAALVVALVAGLLVAIPAPAGAVVIDRDPFYYGGLKYVKVGNAPMRVLEWANVGVTDPTGIPTYTDAQWTNLRAVPDHGTFIQGYGTPEIYRVVDGGHAYHVKDWAPYGGEQPYHLVDPWAIANCDHLNCSPWGALEVVQAVGPETVRLAGWAMDPDTATPVPLSYQVGDAPRSGAGAVASLARTDIAQRYQRGANFGFDHTVRVEAGLRTVCVWAGNLGARGEATRIGCRDVVVPAPPVPAAALPGKVKRPKVEAQRKKAVVRWKAPTPGQSPIIAYRVESSNGRSLTTPKTKAVLRRLKSGKKLTFVVCAYNKFGPGPCSKPSEKVRIR